MNKQLNWTTKTSSCIVNVSLIKCIATNYDQSTSIYIPSYYWFNKSVSDSLYKSLLLTGTIWWQLKVQLYNSCIVRISSDLSESNWESYLDLRECKDFND